MNASPEIIKQSKVFLDPFLENIGSKPTDVPFVTLTWAQSLDGYLTQNPGKPTPISGAESLVLTHYLRSVHDGILVGISTVLSDNPSLGCRLPFNLGSWTSPRPIVLDSRLRIPLDCRLVQENRELVVVGSTTLHNQAQKSRLEEKGIKVVLVDSDLSGLDLRQLLEALARLGMKRLMVEGGASVLSSFIARRLGNLLVMTVAPKFFLRGVSLGVGSSSESGVLDVHRRASMSLGSDLIIAGNL